MKRDAQVVVIGGGVVGASVLYHLTKAGWTDVVLIERRELTAGSTWHAAGGMHTLNGDPNVARLQQYTIQLYEEIQRVSGQDCSIHLPGGLMLADTEVRMDFLRMAVARGRYLGMDLELISAKEAADLFPLMDPQYFVGALYDPVEGHVDPSGVTRAYVKCAQLAGAEVYQHTRVVGLEQQPNGMVWDVILESGDVIHADHVVNAGGLWAREIGRMVGLELPVLAMEHHYLITDDMPEVAAHVAKTGHEMPMALDFAGEIYIRQEGGAMLLGTYEQACVPWSPRETPWDFGSQLLKPDLDRLTPELSVAFRHYPAMGTTGIRRVVNGPFTFSPDGNPLVGPIRGLRGFWVACGVMAGLSQGGGVGLALATWMTAGDHGDSGMDIWAMDVARYGDYATLAYTNAKVQENYRRRFRITFPNEELPGGRPLLTTPIHDRLTAANAVWGATSGLEHALWFQEPGLPPLEEVTFRRSNAWTQVAAEVAAVRERVGMTEVSNYAKYRVTGPGAEAWLSSLLTQRMPAPGRITLTAMLNDQGRIVGEFTVARATEADEFHLFGSLPAEVHHSRWFRAHLPEPGRRLFGKGAPAADDVRFEVLGLGLTGLSVAGPRSRDVLAAVAPDLDLSTEAFPFMSFRRVDLGMVPCHLARINYAGDLGYEVWVAPEYQRTLFDLIVAAGEPHGLRLFGMRALMSLRLEKSYGTWFREYRPIYTVPEAGLGRYVRLDHDFIGRAAYEAEASAGGPARRLVAMVVEPDPDDPADVIGDEPIWHDGTVVGWVTSGGYGHHVRASLALGYVPTELSTPDGRGGSGFEIEIIGRRRPARLQPEPPFDPQGLRMRQ
jgi:dimethylglycine dehydrogenase